MTKTDDAHFLSPEEKTSRQSSTWHSVEQTSNMRCALEIRSVAW